MSFLRFSVSQLDIDSGVEGGLFGAAYALECSDDVQEDDRSALQELLAWFEEHLPTPERFNRTSSKGYYRRTTKGIAWFRDSAKEHIARMHELKLIVEANGYQVMLVREDRIGYVVLRGRGAGYRRTVRRHPDSRMTRRRHGE